MGDPRQGRIEPVTYEDVMNGGFEFDSYNVRLTWKERDGTAKSENFTVYL
jgi:hypothetical protein